MNDIEFLKKILEDLEKINNSSASITPLTYKLEYSLRKVLNENKELKEITNGYDAICKLDSDYILVANKKYFDNGIFKENLVNIGKVFNIIDSYIQEYEKQKDYRYTGDVDDEIEVLKEIKKKIGKD